MASQQQTFSAAAAPPLPCPPHEIRAAVERIEGSRLFADANRLRTFLAYVVEEYLAGRSDHIKGFTIAQDVFHRTDPEDAQTSTIVRVEAARLRRRLTEYYAKEGRNDPVRIEIAKGAYVPSFERTAENGTDSEPPLAPEATQARLWTPRHIFIIGTLIAVGIVMGLFSLTTLTQNNAGLQTPVDTAPANSAAMLPTVAVLPFENRTSGGADKYLAAGLTEDIITDLSKLPGVNVIAQSSVAAFEGQNLSPQRMAEKLGVNYVLRGSVRGQSPNFRVTAQLYDARTDRQIWAQRFDRDLRDVLEFQNELAVRVVQGMSVSLRSDDGEQFLAQHVITYKAEVLYRQAMDDLNPPTNATRLQIARQAFQRLIEMDPGYAGGYAGVAYTYVFATFWNHSATPEADLQTAVALAEKALATDPTFGMAYTTLAFVELIRKNFAAAVERSGTALEVQPGDPYVNIYHAYLLAADGQAAQGVAYAERALQLDPLTERAPYLNILATVSFHAGEYQKSHDAVRKNQERGGPSADSFEAYIVAANVALGRLDVARAHLQILDSYGDSGNSVNLPLVWFRHPKAAAEKVLSPIRELRDADAALAEIRE